MRAQAAEFYAEHTGKGFFDDLLAFMTSGDVVALVLYRRNAIRAWRALMGATDSRKAREQQPKSIRAQWGTDNQRNAVHGSDSPASARREVRFFFPNELVDPILPPGAATDDYLQRNLSPALIKGLTELCRHKPADPLTWLAEWLLANNPNAPRVNEPSVA